MLARALDAEGMAVDAAAAESKHTYFCPQCSEPVRLKKGVVRAAHFFHIARTPECRLSQKTYLHALIQEMIYERLPSREKRLEHPFSSIARIADVVSFDQRAVFEVQISNIKVEEMKRRTRDYKKVALDTVWVLHERRFKKVDYPLYYLTDIDDEGRGSIFDPLTGPIDITCCLRLDAPLHIYKAGQIYFRGDRIWKMLNGELVLEAISRRERYREWLLARVEALL